ncbi:hypothetical protein E2C01_032401 [Portunus trituberculatus]|uniref:Uncharacterized protein n=1 Tax=Portunus trituberculatus TaxID=210409 RepID=A0A5B7EZJ2_PORTR|nr:hypothetical protein [Portunus trituberculatus]
MLSPSATRKETSLRERCGQGTYPEYLILPPDHRHLNGFYYDEQFVTCEAKTSKTPTTNKDHVGNKKDSPGPEAPGPNAATRTQLGAPELPDLSLRPKLDRKRNTTTPKKTRSLSGTTPPPPPPPPAPASQHHQPSSSLPTSPPQAHQHGLHLQHNSGLMLKQTRGGFASLKPTDQTSPSTGLPDFIARYCLLLLLVAKFHSFFLVLCTEFMGTLWQLRKKSVPPMLNAPELLPVVRDSAKSGLGCSMRPTFGPQYSQTVPSDVPPVACPVTYRNTDTGSKFQNGGN